MRINPLAPPYYCSITAIVKDEANYIEEWINFHSFLGVEHFLYTITAAQTIHAKFLKIRLCDTYLLATNKQGNAQTKAYVHALKEFGVDRAG